MSRLTSAPGCYTIAECLLRIGMLHGISDVEMARLAECSPDTIGRARRDESDMSASRLVRLGRGLKREHGIDCLAWIMLDAQEGETDGSHLDEVAEVVELLGEASRHWKDRTWGAALALIPAIRRAVDRLEREIRAKIDA